MTKSPKDIGASVRARLLRLARERGEDFQLLLTRYANERLLYRLASSEYGSHFVLKGAALFTLWTGAPHRATRDVDLLGFGDPNEDQIRSVFADVLAVEVNDDGVRFDASTLEVGPIREEQEYGGVRVHLAARVTSAKVRLQIDVGFGDVITPEAVAVDFPTLLDFPAPKLRAYPRETVVAEKLEAMVKLGQANTRMKDFYDLAALSETFAFEGALLVRAIGATFARRRTPLPSGLPVALTSEFTEDPAKSTQWRAFLRKSGAPSRGELREVVATIARFVEEPLTAAAAEAPFAKHWAPGGLW
ncbi:MAG: nucleotidyl transferase AbiEii/AbiGii toxin family protein, partial [Myxococcales bacterium]|nr:nucleotidyl transferase AbiEii/AbiGii toxin family protein [Myxococcales bacterium]